MDPRPGGAPTVLRMVLGRHLQDLREQAGISLEQAGRTLDVTHATIRRMEKAEVGLKLPYVEKLLTTYVVTSTEEISGFLALPREANRPGWWHRFRDVLPDWFKAFVSLEGEASVIRAYEPHYVPGLLQTSAYARATLHAGLPHAAEPGDRRAGHAADRTPVAGAPGQCAVALVRHGRDRAAPPDRQPQGHAGAGGRAHRGGGTAQRPVAHHALRGGPAPGDVRPFHIFRFQLQEFPDTACTESLVGGVYFGERDDVPAFLEALDRMCSQAAPAQSAKAILDGMRKDLQRWIASAMTAHSCSADHLHGTRTT